jgi:two-component sensor histidine kinase
LIIEELGEGLGKDADGIVSCTAFRDPAWLWQTNSMAMQSSLNPSAVATGHERPATRWAKIWALSLAVATVVAFSAALVAYVGRLLSGRPISIADSLTMTLPDWYFWALVAPFAIFLARRFPIGGHRRSWHTALHVAIGVVVAILQIVVFTWSYRTIAGPLGFPTYGSFLFFTSSLWFHYQFFVYWVIVLGVHAYEYYGRYRERQLQSARLETELIRAQLHSLRSQIQPHFLFNSLHTIAMLMREQRVEEATDMIARLGELMRKTLDGDGAQEVRLEDELQLARDYLAIEQVRFGDRLRVRFDVQGEARDALVPAMVLQPLVENAVRHGVSRRAEAGTIDVQARIDGRNLLICVRDDGPGFGGTPDESSTHLGLANTRRRLQHMYGTDQRLDVVDAEGGGAAVTLLIPLRPFAVAGSMPH